MRLMTFDCAEPGTLPHWGFLDLEGVLIDVTTLAARSGRDYPRGVADLVTRPPDDRAELLGHLSVLSTSERASAARRPDDVTVRAPIPNPGRNVFAAGANYRSHVEESAHSAAEPDRPIFFTKATTSVTGPGDVVVESALTTRVDWEVEVAVVLGAGGRHLSPSAAQEAIFGYMTANDLSARDQQHGRPEGQWFLGKSLDGFGPLGPWLVTADEVSDPQNLTLSLTVNGVLKQRASTAGMIFPIAELVAELSRFITMRPGDIILTGTPAGVGDARTPPEYLSDGDTVTAEVTGLGALTNRMVFT
jgi:2-keto-4-pentenoate hydratase/2-oxohepta-3-ene-1,7-dioic acid hydratase in catechol pathway